MSENIQFKFIINDNADVCVRMRNQEDIDDEELYIQSITGNKLKVRRGEDNTTAAAHVKGADIKKITASDNALIEMGDDFGFDGSF